MSEIQEQIFFRLAIAASLQKEDVISGLSGYINRVIPFIQHKLECRHAMMVREETGLLHLLWSSDRVDTNVLNQLGFSGSSLSSTAQNPGQPFTLVLDHLHYLVSPANPSHWLIIARKQEFTNRESELWKLFADIFAKNCNTLIEHEILHQNTDAAAEELEQFRSFFSSIDGSHLEIPDQKTVSEKLSRLLKLQYVITRMATEFINIPVDQSDEAINKMLALVGRENKVDRVYIFSYDFEKRLMSNTYEWCDEDVSPEIANLQDIPLDLFPSWVQTHTNGEMLIVPNVNELDHSDPLWEALEPQGILTLVTIPMIFNGKCLGFVGFDSVKTIKKWGDEEITFLRLLADLLCNVTDKITSARELKKATEAATAANEAKTRFLANMSHEIRTPLNAIIGMVRLLLESRVDPSQLKLLNNMKTSSENLLSIINDILDFSKIESGQIEISKSDFSIHDLVRKVYDGNEFRAEDKGIKFRYTIHPKIEKYLKGDSLRLFQVLNNLVSNAIKFTSEGKVEVRLELLGADKSGQLIQFSVEDTGIGISPENQEKIFKSFQQEDESITRNFGGTGLGLPISRQLVELMGGKLDLESTKDVGSKFSFIIDLEVGEEPEPEPVIEHRTETGKTLENKRILLVEDNKFNQFIAQAMLEKWGANVFIAEDGEQAVERLRSESFELILMDIQMPVMDGITATTIIRNELKINTPILALTANVVVGIVDRCLQAGMQGYIPKPIDEENLLEKILSLLEPATRVVQLTDLSRMVKNFGSNRTTIHALIEKFIEVTPGYVEELRKAAEIKDIVGIEDQSHKIKTSLKYVASDMLSELMTRINDIGKIGKDHPEQYTDSPEVYELIDTFAAYFPTLIKQLEDHLRE